MIFEKRGRTFFSSLLAVLTVLIFASCGKTYHVGDVVLEDGTVLSSEKFASYNGKSKPESVIFSLHGGDSENSDRVIGVMLQDYGEYPFANSAYIGASYDSDFNATIVINQYLDVDSGTYKNLGFSGGFDGRYIAYNLSKNDIENLDELRKSYIAVSACYEKGAYLPSAAELYLLFESSSVINAVLTQAGGAAIDEGIYWTSSCDYSDDKRQFTVNMENGQITSEERPEVYKVRGIKCYTNKKAAPDATYNLGDIIMDDGTILKRDEFQSYNGSAKPMAVIFSLRGGHFEETRRVLGVGLNASNPVVFAEAGSTGQLTNFTLNQAITVSEEYDIQKGLFTNAGVIGVKNGEESWENVCKMDNGKDTDIKNYPAYDYAVNYGKNNGFTKYQKGWYLPSSMETYELFEALTDVNRSLELCGAKPIPSEVWTSTQNYYVKNNQYLQDMKYGEVQVGFKSTAYPAISVYCFEKIKKTVKE